MDSFNGPGASFTAAMSPPPPEPTPEPEGPGISIEQLMAENQKLQAQMLKQSQEADRKITQVMEQNQLLNQTLSDKLMDLSSNTHSFVQAGHEDSGTDWETAWEKMYGQEPSRYTQTQQPQQQGEKPSVDPKLVRKLIREETPKVVSKIAQAGMEAQQQASEKQKELMDRFTEEAKDLHPWANEVVAIWNRLARANPNQDMEDRYSETIEAARELFANKSPQRQQSTTNFPTGGQSRGGGSPSPFSTLQNIPDPSPNNIQQELKADDSRRRQLEEYVRNRQQALKKRQGFFAQPGQG